LFFREVEMLIFDFGVALIYYFAAVLGFGIPPPTILTEAVLMFEPLLAYEIILPLEGGFKVEFLF
jgi:hypothetical protein